MREPANPVSYRSHDGQQARDVEPDRRRRIVLCDADEVSTRLLSSILAPRAFDIVLCRTAMEAEAAVDDHEPELVITAILLPDEDGLALTRRLRASHPALPILVVSALHARNHALQAGANAFLSKPAAVSDLVALALKLTTRRDTASVESTSARHAKPGAE